MRVHCEREDVSPEVAYGEKAVRSLEELSSCFHSPLSDRDELMLMLDKDVGVDGLCRYHKLSLMEISPHRLYLLVAS